MDELAAREIAATPAATWPLGKPGIACERDDAAFSQTASPATDAGDGDDLPQAIADDYPGWAVTQENGRWSAWCPAVTVHADNAAALRIAMEEAIWGGTEH